MASEIGHSSNFCRS